MSQYYYYFSSITIDAEVKGLCGMYQRIIMIPRPDYASRVCKHVYNQCM